MNERKEKPIIRYILVKFQKSKDKEKISDFQREKNRPSRQNKDWIAIRYLINNT